MVTYIYAISHVLSIGGSKLMHAHVMCIHRVSELAPTKDSASAAMALATPRFNQCDCRTRIIVCAREIARISASAAKTNVWH